MLIALEPLKFSRVSLGGGERADLTPKLEMLYADDVRGSKLSASLTLIAFSFGDDFNLSSQISIEFVQTGEALAVTGVRALQGRPPVGITFIVDRPQA